MTELALSPLVDVSAAMTSVEPVDWSGAVWIGSIDDADFTSARLVLCGLTGYRTARLLVRSGRFPRGFVEVAVVDGQVDREEVLAAVATLPPAKVRPPSAREPISIVLCTYDRPLMLEAALNSILTLEYPFFEVVVVDNNPSSGLTPPVVRGICDRRVRLVEEPRTGLARARNTGALAATSAVVAFTDDDVTIDRYWLQGISDGFAAGPDVACVSGIVPSGEIACPSQAYFDRRVSWARSCSAEVFCLAAPRPDEPLFPFQVGRYGTGANFALRRSVLFELGGFDEGLGIGSKCGGGEDIDVFVRVLLAGHQLAYEPSALIWHRHRADLASLRHQIINYGTGLGAWPTKLALHPRTLAMITVRLVPGLIHLRKVTRLQGPVDGLLPEHDLLWKVERRAVVLGPFALLRSRLSGARARPLNTHDNDRTRHRLEPREQS